MNVDLDKQDLVALVKGTFPNYDVMDHPLVARNGYYVGGFKDEWHWNSNLHALPDEQLMEIYTICKRSLHK